MSYLGVWWPNLASDRGADSRSNTPLLLNITEHMADMDDFEDDSKQRRRHWTVQVGNICFRSTNMLTLLMSCGAMSILLFVGSLLVAGPTASILNTAPRGVCIFDTSALMSTVDFAAFPGALDAQLKCLQMGYRTLTQPQPHP